MKKLDHFYRMFYLYMLKELELAKITNPDHYPAVRDYAERLRKFIADVFSIEDLEPIPEDTGGQ